MRAEPSESADALIGVTLPAGVVIRERLAVGGMGCIYRAEQTTLGRTVAVKVVHPHLLGDSTIEKRFVTEARTASRLNHPNSVSIIDFGEFEGRFYLVMEYLRGQDLSVVTRDEAPIAPMRTVDILLQVLAAVEQAHALGIVHRDLKPENIMVESMRTGRDVVKVLDFGLAQVREQLARTTLTRPGVVCGTPQYMAPEQARGEAVDERADLYACGVIAYEMLTGRLPYEAHTPRHLVSLHSGSLPSDPRDLCPQCDFPDQLIEVLMRALASDPRSRYHTAREMTEALTLAIESEREPPPSSADTRPCMRCDAPVFRSQRFCGQCGEPVVRRRLRPSTGTTPTTAEASPSEGFPLPLRARDGELDWLSARLDATDGGFKAVCVAGGAGVGKTRLLTVFGVLAEQQGARVVWVRPDPWWAKAGYFGLREAIVQLAALPAENIQPSSWAGAFPEARAGLAAVFSDPETAQRERDSIRPWAQTPPEMPAPSNHRLLVAEALRWAIEQACATTNKRVVLIVDDLVHIDGATRNALADLISEPPFESVMLVAGHGTNCDPKWDGAETLLLGGLPAAVVDKLLDSVPAARELMPIEDDVPPLYVEQLMRFATEGGESAPPRLADLIAARIQLLAVDARRLLQAIAVVGDAAPAAQIVALVPDLGDMRRHLHTLRRCGWIEMDDDRASVAHPLVRAVTMATTPVAVRRQLHSRARHDCGLDTLQIPLEAHALHACHAGEPFEALVLLEQCALRAGARDDDDGLLSALRKGREIAREELRRGVLDEPIDAVVMFSCKLGDALASAGMHAEATKVLEETIADISPTDVLRPRVLASMASVANAAGMTGEADSLLREALSLARQHEDGPMTHSLERMNESWRDLSP